MAERKIQSAKSYHSVAMPNYLTMKSLQNDMRLIRSCSDILLCESPTEKEGKKEKERTNCFELENDIKKSERIVLCICPFCPKPLSQETKSL